MKLSNNTGRFLEEIKAAVEADYADFCLYQTKTQETLMAFHELCVTHDITYYLAYGSLLGAVRDGGQIPWDYDIDVWVPYNQAQKLMDALDEDMSEEYHYITRFKAPDYRTYTLKLAPKEYDCEVLHVDVFWLTGAYDEQVQNEKIHKLKKKHHNISLIEYCPIKYLGITGRIPKMLHTLRRIKYAPYTMGRLDRIFQTIMQKDLEESRLWTDNEEPKEFDREWFGQPQQIRVSSGAEFNVPANYEEILNLLYGDYMAVPNIQSRMEEFRSSLKRLNLLAKK